MSANILPFDSSYSALRIVFIRSNLHTEHKVGIFMRDVEKLVRLGLMMPHDFTKIQQVAAQMLEKHCYTVQGLQALEQWQRNAFAAQLGQAMLRIVDTELLYECEKEAHTLKEQLGIGKTARAFMQPHHVIQVQETRSKGIGGNNVLSFARRIQQDKSEAEKLIIR